MDRDAAVASKKLMYVSKRKQEPPLHMPFELPINFPENIKVGLAEKQLVGRKRSKFVTKIAEAMYFQKSYPTLEEYKHVAGVSIKKWPFLEKTAGQVFSMAKCSSSYTLSCMFTFYRVTLRRLHEQMSYLRKPDGEKRGKSCDGNEEKTPKLKKYHRQMPASPVFTPLEEGEDRASHDRHVKILQQECKNATPSKQVSLFLTFII